MEVQAKTFPIKTTDVWLAKVKEAADKKNMSMHSFIVDAVEKEVKETLNK